uniref:Uncharacterized protein n=1 Tax=Meloidogyne hapla TaxID=6305 RepID=A0A1I8BNG9_MELHA
MFRTIFSLLVILLYFSFENATKDKEYETAADNLKNYVKELKTTNNMLAKKLNSELAKIENMNPLALGFFVNFNKFENLKNFLDRKIEAERDNDNKTKLEVLNQSLNKLIELGFEEILKLRGICSVTIVFPFKEIEEHCIPFRQIVDKILKIDIL